MTSSIPNIYETMARIVLPEKILDVFDVTSVIEENTGVTDETGTERVSSTSILDERDMRVEI